MISRLLIYVGEIVYQTTPAQKKKKYEKALEKTIYDIENYYSHELDYDLDKRCKKLDIYRQGPIYLLPDGKQIFPKKMKDQLNALNRQVREQQRLKRKDNMLKLKIEMEKYRWFK